MSNKLFISIFALQLITFSLLPAFSKHNSSLNLNKVQLQEISPSEQNEKLLNNVQDLNLRVFELEKKVKELEIELLKAQIKNNQSNNNSEMFDYLTRSAALREVNETKLFGRKNTANIIEKIANGRKNEQ